jgi:TusE/DsrC/DsvC family sulfur relay protein
MSQVAYAKGTIEVDEEGFLTRSEEWNEDVAKTLAAREGVGELGPTKLDILRFLREYYRKFASFPILGKVCREVQAQSRRCVTDEFVDPMKAWKIAGLPKPPQVFFTSFDGKTFAANPFY